MAVSPPAFVCVIIGTLSSRSNLQAFEPIYSFVSLSFVFRVYTTCSTFARFDMTNPKSLPKASMREFRSLL
jgi:hypothetical protein